VERATGKLEYRYVKKENDISMVKLFPFEQRLILYNQNTKVCLLSYDLTNFYNQTEPEFKEIHYKEFIGNHYEHQVLLCYLIKTIFKRIESPL
jgi:hypothetical protein